MRLVLHPAQPFFWATIIAISVYCTVHPAPRLAPLKSRDPVISGGAAGKPLCLWVLAWARVRPCTRASFLTSTVNGFWFVTAFCCWCWCSISKHDDTDCEFVWGVTVGGFFARLLLCNLTLFLFLFILSKHPIRVLSILPLCPRQ